MPNFTYDGFLTAASNAGLLGEFSQADLDTARKYPEFGYSILGLKQDIHKATTPEAKLLANEAANQLRSSYGGYTGGKYGADYISDGKIPNQIDSVLDKINGFGSFTFDQERPSYENQYAEQQQALLDAIINRLITLIQRESTREFISDQIVHWLKTEHPRKAMVLPTEWLGDQSAEMVSNAVNTLLDDISHDRTHQIRRAFDRATLKLIDNLKNDPEMTAKADNIKHYLKNDEAFNRYLGEMWADLRQWLKNDMQSDDSRVKQRIANAGLWFGETLSNDASLRASLNEHLEQAAHRVAPDFAAFLTRHISDTVKSWDAKDMSRQIELNIGKDLQFIRVNGTLVGGTIGLILFLLSQLPAVLGH